LCAADDRGLVANNQEIIMSDTTQVIVVASEKEASLVQRATELVSQLGDVAVETEADAENAAAFIKICRETAKAADQERLSITRPITEITKDIKARVDGAVVKPLVEARAKVQGLLDAYVAKQEAERRERVRLEREEQERKALAEAEAAAESGNDHLADHALQKAEKKTVAERERVAVRSEHGASAGSRTVWRGRVTNLNDLLQAVINGDIDDSVISVSQSGVDAFARREKAEGVKYGIQVISETKAIVR
jgi:hypothetical protein